MMVAVRLMGVAALVVGSLGVARAQPFGADGAWDRGAVRHGTPVQALPTPFSQGGSCVQWCVADASPCDPDYFKVADRRCNVNLNGYFQK